MATVLAALIATTSRLILQLLGIHAADGVGELAGAGLSRLVDDEIEWHELYSTVKQACRDRLVVELVEVHLVLARGSLT